MGRICEFKWADALFAVCEKPCRIESLTDSQSRSFRTCTGDVGKDTGPIGVSLSNVNCVDDPG